MATGNYIHSNDGEIAIEVGPWAKDKLHYVKGFCEIFNLGMKRNWKNRAYIDIFSGPGRCIIDNPKEEIPGSPLLALNCNVPFTHYYFNDDDSDLINALKNRTKQHNTFNINYYHTDCNLVIDMLLKDLPSYSLDFCFIDPLNWEISFDSIRKLTSGRKMDLAITFHIGMMKRTADKPNEKLKSFFPDNKWQEKYLNASNSKKGHILLESYEKGF
jgi:three-Cys-motif partner protein